MPDWVPCGRRGVKAHHLAPSHRRARLRLGAILRAESLSASSSIGSPLPAVLATRCHFSPSTLSSGAPVRYQHPRETVLCDRTVLPGGLAQQRHRGRSFFGVPVPLYSAMAYSTSASTLSASAAA